MTDTLTSPVRTLRDGTVALIEIDNPPVNASSHAVRAGLLAAIEAADADPTVEAMVIACAGRTFVAGADIREFGKPLQPPGLPEVVNRIEAASKPTVAAIHGTALGGGFEIALACHSRIAVADAQVGLPEVKLGIIPGAGGTQRLPRLVGLTKAIEIITSGRQVKADEALKLGILDRLTPGDLRAEAIAQARSLVGKPLRRTGALPVPPHDAAALEAQMTEVKRRARGQVSPVRAAEITRLVLDRDVVAGMAAERSTFMELVVSDQAAALRHAFFAEREVARVPALDGIVPRPVASAGVIGAGTMGAGIAVALADARLSVTVVETSEAALEAGRGRIAGLYDRSIASRRLTEGDKAERLGRITFATDLAALAGADLVIEAVFEEMDVKKVLFRKLDAVAKPGAILASNTSYLDVGEIAAVTARPADVVGLHFFSPAHVMKLVEVVRAPESALDAVQTGMALAKKLGKIGVVAGVCDGFIGNRILASYRKQCDYMLEDGALPQDIDAAMEAYGLPMGPFAANDLAGLDIGWARRKRLAPTRDPRDRYVALADRLCELGRFGQKTGAGWYRYEAGKRVVDPEITALIERHSAEKGIARQPIPPDEIQARIRAAMVNEGAKILAEGIAARALDIDIVMMNGYNFPAWRGGPMFEADRIGLAAILAEVERTHARDGFGWEPAPLLVELAKSGRGFKDLNPMVA